MPESDPLHEALNDVIDEVDCVDKRISQLFAFGRPRQLRTELMTLAEIAENAQAEASSIVNSKRITLRTFDHTGDTKWQVDRQQMAITIGELFVNAAHHSHDQGTVILTGSLIRDNNAGN